MVYSKRLQYLTVAYLSVSLSIPSLPFICQQSAQVLRSSFKQIKRDQAHLWAREVRHRKTVEFNSQHIAVSL